MGPCPPIWTYSFFKVRKKFYVTFLGIATLPCGYGVWKAFRLQLNAGEVDLRRHSSVISAFMPRDVQRLRSGNDRTNKLVFSSWL